MRRAPITKTRCTDFVCLAASDIAGGPVARVRLPFRVPAGLHGTWLPSADLPG